MVWFVGLVFVLFFWVGGGAGGGSAGGSITPFYMAENILAK